jgi:hypothetical protein
MTMRTITRIGCGAALAVLAAIGAAPAQTADLTAGTPAELVGTYNTLADVILSAKKSEANLVRSILAATYRHAEANLGMAKAQVQAGQDARVTVEKLATLVSQLGNEGDAAVAAIRKRLLEGGHHHNAAGEAQGIFDEGFVIVTKASRKVFLDAAGQIARLAPKPDAASLDAAWKGVAAEYAKLMAPGR